VPGSGQKTVSAAAWAPGFSSEYLALSSSAPNPSSGRCAENSSKFEEFFFAREFLAGSPFPLLLFF
jgi:hypothetical protein